MKWKLNTPSKSSCRPGVALVLGMMILAGSILSTFYFRSKSTAPLKEVHPSPGQNPPSITQLKTLPEIARDLKGSENQPVFSNFKKELLAMLEQDDVCGIARSQVFAKLSLQELIEEVENLPDLITHSSHEDELFHSLIRGVSSRDKSQLREAFSGTNAELVFVNALFLGDLFSGLENEEPDLEESIRLLEWLKATDPGNGAYAYFLAQVRDKAHQSQEEVENELQLSLKSQRFETPLRPFVQRIIERGLTTPSRSLWATQIIMQLPIPDLVPSFRLQKKFLAKGGTEIPPEISKDALSFGEVLMREGNENGRLREFVYWSALDYSIGFGTFKFAWEKLYPNQPMPEEARENYQKFYRNNPQHDWAQALWDKLNDPHIPCPKTEAIRFNQTEKDIYLSFKKGKAFR